MKEHFLLLAAEDVLGATLLGRLISDFAESFEIVATDVAGGFSELRRDIEKYVNIARHQMPVLLVTDLDMAACPVDLVDSWFRDIGPPPPDFLFRVAVREVESWVLADHSNLAQFLGISEDIVTTTPDALPDPKREVLRLVGRSRQGRLKREMLPAAGALAAKGPGYNEHLCRFVRSTWNSGLARQRSPSLERAITRLDGLVRSRVG